MRNLLKPQVSNKEDDQAVANYMVALTQLQHNLQGNNSAEYPQQVQGLRLSADVEFVHLLSLGNPRLAGTSLTHCVTRLATGGKKHSVQ